MLPEPLVSKETTPISPGYWVTQLNSTKPLKRKPVKVPAGLEMDPFGWRAISIADVSLNVLQQSRIRLASNLTLSHREKLRR